MKRATMRSVGPNAIALQTAETRYSTPTQKSVGLRPIQSHTFPPPIAPRTVPHRAELITRPCTKDERLHTD